MFVNIEKLNTGIKKAPSAYRDTKRRFFYMDNYFEMEALAQKSNYRRLRQLDKKQKHSIVRDSTEKSSSFQYPDDHCAADFVSDDGFEADRCVKLKPCVCVSDG